MHWPVMQLFSLCLSQMCLFSQCYVNCRMELCHISDQQLKTRLKNASQHLEPITPVCDVYRLQPYKIYGMSVTYFSYYRQVHVLLVVINLLKLKTYACCSV